MRHLLLVPLLATACSYPQFVAKKTLEVRVLAASLQQLRCDSHNGDIAVIAEAGRVDIDLHAQLSVRGHTQEEAEANLSLLQLGQDEVDGMLHVYGTYPPGELGNRSPSFTFSLRVPPRLAVQLTSHNGDVSVNGTHGAAAIETHNGDIDGSITADKVVATTHNGDIELGLGATGDLAGTITTHNGNVVLDLAPGISAMLDASTHNGRVTAPAQVTDANHTKRRLKGRLGEGRGTLVVESHNGDVVLR